VDVKTTLEITITKIINSLKIKKMNYKIENGCLNLFANPSSGDLCYIIPLNESDIADKRPFLSTPGFQIPFDNLNALLVGMLTMEKLNKADLLQIQDIFNKQVESISVNWDMVFTMADAYYSWTLAEPELSTAFAIN